jgi:hypothetical protein
MKHASIPNRRREKAVWAGECTPKLVLRMRADVGPPVAIEIPEEQLRLALGREAWCPRRGRRELSAVRESTRQRKRGRGEAKIASAIAVNVGKMVGASAFQRWLKEPLSEGTEGSSKTLAAKDPFVTPDANVRASIAVDIRKVNVLRVG